VDNGNHPGRDRSRPPWTLTFTLLVVAIVLTTRPIRAAAALSVDAVASDRPVEIALDFAEPLDNQFVKVQVLDDKGVDHVKGLPTVSADRKRLSVPVVGLRPGVFLVQWGVIDGQGRLSKGTFTFEFVSPGISRRDSRFELSGEAGRSAIREFDMKATVAQVNSIITDG